jgi:YgiT-type zinc finger domain-containing protein
MICLVCRQADLTPGLTSVIFERGELRLVINSVPANVCPSCGEAYVDEDVAMQLLETAEEMSAAGAMDDVLEFGKA